ncbi:MAG TPA: hypothetical protein VMV89_11285 [Candidatus Paceibacterota bacterium]|nr:hypothetical protein [Candidatus Paceibacterota bacterium]
MKAEIFCMIQEYFKIAFFMEFSGWKRAKTSSRAICEPQARAPAAVEPLWLVFGIYLN